MCIIFLTVHYSAVMKLLHYGLQRSGTNFLETAIKKNYRVKFLNDNQDRSSPLHKHFRLYDEKEIIPEPQYRNDLETAGFKEFERLLEVVPDYYLVISKDPYSWLLSYTRWAEQCHWPDVSHHYLIEYNLFYGKWLEFSGQTDRILFVRYLDLLQASDKELSRLESQIALKKKFLSPFTSRLITKVPQSEEFSNNRREYYLTRQYLKSYTREELHTINTLIDPQLLSGLDYQNTENIQ